MSFNDLRSLYFFTLKLNVLLFIISLFWNVITFVFLKMWPLWVVTLLSVEALLQLGTNEGSGYERSLQPSEYWPLIGQGWQILTSYWLTSQMFVLCFGCVIIMTQREKFYLNQTVKWKVNLRWFRNKVYGDNLLRFISTRADCFVRKLPEKPTEKPLIFK